MEKKTVAGAHWFRYLFMLLAAALPLVYSGAGVDPNLLPRQTVLSIYVIAGAIILITGLKQTDRFMMNSLVPLLFIVLAALYWFSGYGALNETEARYVAIKIALYGSLFWVTCLLISEGHLDQRAIITGFALSCMVTVLLAVRDMYMLDKMGVRLFESDHIYKVNATFGHKNLLSAYLLFTLPFVILLFHITKSKPIRLLLVILALSAVVILVLLQTRAALLGFVVGMFALSVLLFMSYSKRKKLGSKLVPVVLVAGILLFVSGLYMFRGKLSVISRTESFKERAALWENSWQMLQEHPGGVGAGNWQIWLPRYGVQKFYEFNYRVTEGLTTFQRPHNDFIWVFCETGYAGGIIYLILFGLLVFYGFRNFTMNKDQAFIHAMFLTFVIMYAVVALVDFPLERMEHSFVFAVGAAWIIAQVKQSRVKLAVNKWLLVIPVIIAGFSVHASAKRTQSEKELVKMYKAHREGNWQELISRSQKASTGYMNMDYFSIPISWYTGVGFFTSGDLVRAKQYFMEAYDINPYQVHVLNNLGVCYEKEKNYAKALPLLEQAHQISPTFSDGISTLAGAYYNVGRYEDAWNVISKFRYDGQNPQFITFATAIIKARLIQMAETEKDKTKQKLLFALSTHDQYLMQQYKKAQEEGVPYFELLLKNYK